ncbi:MAG TPA: DUF924 family protein [Rhodocyclaceae bacterium]|nr:DUF924 family protein [Rhodocyclaceae bacterium]
MENPQSLVHFWFGTDPDDAVTAARQAGLWWGKDGAVDAEMARRYGHLPDDALAGRLDGWAATPAGRLALILVTDQFPRNIFRGTAQAFAFDATARRLCREGLAHGQDRALRPIERVFFYLPLEHSEDADDQALSVTLFEALAAEVAMPLQPIFDGYADYARRHRDIVARWGRFPHRNAVLGRASTAAEDAFLQEPGSSF